MTITQRTALLNHVDKILVLNSGTVAMFGERQQVLQVLTGKGQEQGQVPEAPREGN